MKKMSQRVLICLFAAAFLWLGSVIADREKLNSDLIRLHVVAASDSAEDQDIKLRVRDAVNESLRQGLEDVADVNQAKTYLQENLGKIEKIANQVLAEAGCADSAVVTLGKEAFDTRYYDTFTLPAGIYEALRITIGEGEGKNWWCVVFPTLCIPATTEGFDQVAAGAGFPDALTAALEGEQGYELRFFLLDWLGEMEKKFSPG